MESQGIVSNIYENPKFQSDVLSCDAFFHTRFATIPPDYLRLASHGTIVALTRHDKNCVWSHRKKSWATIMPSESTFICKGAAGGTITDQDTVNE